MANEVKGLSIGVRCVAKHIGEKGKGENPEKQKARKRRVLQEIQDEP